MTKHGEQHALSNFVHSPTILGPHWEPQPIDQNNAVAADVKSCMNTLYDSRWLIGAITAFITAIAILYALIASPVYEANLMIQVEEESPNASKNVLSEASPLRESGKAAYAEMELVRSRMVVSRAVDNLQSFIDVEPKLFPIAAFWFVNRNSALLATPGLFGYGGYVWGGERADVSVFNVPPTWLNRQFVLTAQGEQRYRLSGGGQHVVFDGVVNNRHLVQTPDGPLETWIQPVDATSWLNRSAGVRYSKVFLGRSFNLRATSLS